MKTLQNKRTSANKCCFHWLLSSGVGVTKPISSVPLFSKILVMWEETLAIEHHVYIWQVSPQLSCGDICQIWMWFEESNMYFCHNENFAYGEINERSFSNPHPWPRRDQWNSFISWSWQCIANWRNSGIDQDLRNNFTSYTKNDHHW